MVKKVKRFIVFVLFSLCVQLLYGKMNGEGKPMLGLGIPSADAKCCPKGSDHLDANGHCCTPEQNHVDEDGNCY